MTPFSFIPLERPSETVAFYDAMNFYETPKWKKKRAAVLARDRYLCQESKRYGKMVQADTVHHIFPMEYFPQYRFSDWNLISLSKEQHNAMHDRETHELTQKGRELLERTARKQGIKYTGAATKTRPAEGPPRSGDSGRG